MIWISNKKAPFIAASREHEASKMARRSHILVMMVAVLLCPLGIKAQSSQPQEWPDIPLITVKTVDGEMPTCTKVETPDSCIGNGVTNNNYVKGRMTITLGSDTTYDSGEYEKDESGMRIKIRGNSSAYFNKYPHYKIKLTKKAALGRGENKDKEWILLKSFIGAPLQYSLLNNHVSAAVASYIRDEWQPQYQFVNLLLNDTYCGLYTLTDPIAKGKGRIEIDDTGYLIENDPYWWNSDSIFFKTNDQNWRLGWTFKYPDEDDINDSIIGNIRDFISEFETALASDSDLTSYINLKSFASWLLAKDVLGLSDGCGSNMFVKKYDFDTANPYSSQLEMAPLWDFDTSFNSAKWSTHHSMNFMYYVSLLRRSDFVDEYIGLWEEKREGITAVVDSVIDAIDAAESEALDESVRLENELHSTEYLLFDDNKEFVQQWFSDRIAWIDEHMESLYKYSSIRENVTSEVQMQRDAIYDITGRRLNAIPDKGLYIQNGKKKVASRYK